MYNHCFNDIHISYTLLKGFSILQTHFMFLYPQDISSRSMYSATRCANGCALVYTYNNMVYIIWQLCNLSKLIQHFDVKKGCTFYCTSSSNKVSSELILTLPKYQTFYIRFNPKSPLPSAVLFLLLFPYPVSYKNLQVC